MHKARQAVIICCLVFCAALAKAQDLPVADTIVVSDSLSRFHLSDQDSAVETQSPFDEQYSHSVPLQQSIPDTVSLREVPAKLTDNLKRRKEFQYANDPAYWRAASQTQLEIKPGLLEKIFEFLGRPGVSNFVLLLFILLGIYLVIRVIIVNNLYVFRSAAKNKELKSGSDDASLMDEDLDEKIRQSVAGGDQRSAVRFLYLKTLKLLDKKGWITYHPQTTNQAYRSEVSHYAKGRDFGFLISVYEYVWYGDFKLSPSQFDTVYRNFTHFQSSLKI